LIKKEVNVQSVNGNLLEITGQTIIPFQIGGIKMSHSFYVVSDMNRNVILGRDWLIQNGVRLYFDLSCLKVQNTYIPLQEDIHIVSVLRLSNKTLLKPQTAYVCWTKARKFHKCYTNSNLYEISAVDTGFIGSQSGVMIGNSVVNMSARNRYPVRIINNTSSKTIALKKGCVIGKLSPISEQNVVELKNAINNVTNIKQDSLKDVNAPAEHKDKIKELINENKDVFASKDSELGHTGKSLKENVDNILSVDSTVFKICCMLIESTKTTFGNYNSTKRINNCNFK
jgi:hypothetical protein